MTFKFKNKELGRGGIEDSYLVVQQINCNGISDRLGELKLNIYAKKPDIVCLSETWLKRATPKFIGYKALWKNRVGRERGGLGILVREDVKHRELNINNRDQGLEMQAIRVLTKLRSIDVVNIYNPGQNIQKNEFEEILEKLGDRYIVIGDFNGHSLLWDSKSKENITGTSLALLVQEGRIGLVNDYNMPTYIDRHTGKTSCLDLCFASLNLVSRGQVTRGEDIGSDHFPIYAKFTINPVRELLECTKRWKTKYAKWELFNVKLENENNFPLDVETNNKVITETILTAARKAIPETGGKRKYVRICPWWDRDCAKAVANRRKAKGALYRNPSLENLIKYKKMEAKGITKKKKKRVLE